MALRFDVSGDSLSRTTNLPAITSWTIMAWVKISVDTNIAASFFNFEKDAGRYYFTGVASDGTTFMLYNQSSGVNGSALTVGTWTHIAATCAGTGAGQFLGYLNGVLDITHAGNVAVTAGNLRVGASNDGDQLNGCIAAYKVFGAVLTANEILNEMRYYVPIRSANINTWLPMVEPVVADNAIDFSGISGNFTVNGTLVVEDGPPIVWAPYAEDVMGMAYDVATGFPGVEGVPLFGSRVGVGVIPLPVMIPVSV